MNRLPVDTIGQVNDMRNHMNMSMRTTVVLDSHEERILKDYMERTGASQSAIIREALRALEKQELVQAYRKAYEEWAGSDDEVLWDVTTNDGIHR